MVLCLDTGIRFKEEIFKSVIRSPQQFAGRLRFVEKVMCRSEWLSSGSMHCRWHGHDHLRLGHAQRDRSEGSGDAYPALVVKLLRNAVQQSFAFADPFHLTDFCHPRIQFPRIRGTCVFHRQDSHHLFKVRMDFVARGRQNHGSLH